MGEGVPAEIKGEEIGELGSVFADDVDEDEVEDGVEEDEEEGAEDTEGWLGREATFASQYRYTFVRFAKHVSLISGTTKAHV